MEKELELKKLDEMVDDFANVMKIKLHRQFKKGWNGYEKTECLNGMAQKGLRKAVALFLDDEWQQAIDVANYAMFCHSLLRTNSLLPSKQGEG